jgi:high-affinity nickel-transport protein
MRHAFDADHIAAIDNTTRKLMADGKRRSPSASGSPSATRASCSPLASCSHRRPGARRPGQDNGSSTLHTVHRPDRHGVSGVFLTSSASQPRRPRRDPRVFRAMRVGEFDEAELDHQLNNRGFMNRCSAA